MEAVQHKDDFVETETAVVTIILLKFLAPWLCLFHKRGIGVDKVALATARRRGTPVAITAGSNTASVWS